jgi:hypothetical protein
MKKAILKRTADILEKLAVAGVAVGLFQGRPAEVIVVGLGFLAASYFFTVLEAKK